MTGVEEYGDEEELLTLCISLCVSLSLPLNTHTRTHTHIFSLISFRRQCHLKAKVWTLESSSTVALFWGSAKVV